MCVFFYLKSHFPQRTKHNDDNHPLMKTIMSSTAGNLLCDGAALTKSPETFEDVLLSLSHDVIEIRSSDETERIISLSLNYFGGRLSSHVFFPHI